MKWISTPIDYPLGNKTFFSALKSFNALMEIENEAEYFDVQESLDAVEYPGSCYPLSPEMQLPYSWLLDQFGYHDIKKDGLIKLDCLRNIRLKIKIIKNLLLQKVVGD